MVIDEKGNSRLEIDPKAALEYVMEHFAPAVPGAWASDCIWTVGHALKKAEARVRELEAERDRMREALVEALRLLDELNYSTTKETADLLRQIGNIGKAEIIIRAALAGGKE